MKYLQESIIFQGQIGNKLYNFILLYQSSSQNEEFFKTFAGH